MDSSLTDEGIERAKELSKRLSDFNIDAIFSSDLKRAKDTAHYIKASHDYFMLFLPELREMSFGDWEGLTLDKVQTDYKEQFDNFEKDPLNYENKNGENFETFVKRVSSGLDKIIQMGFENSLIVTHGITVKAIQTIMESRNLSDISKLPVITGCSLIGYEINENTVKKILQDDKYDFIPK
jgi:phosphoglycerate mutase